MKTMKNVLMILLGAALVLSLAGVGAVAAADEAGTEGTSTTGTQIPSGPITQEAIEKTSDITVSYTIGESFTVTIPPNVILDGDGAEGATFSVDSATLGSKSNLVVTITSTNVWNMTFKENKIPYTMKYKVIDESGNEVTKEITVNDKNTNSVTIYETSTSVTQKVNRDLSFERNAVDLPTVAGTYTDTLTFTITHTPTTGTTPADSAE